jgi:hypothetical protein
MRAHSARGFKAAGWGGTRANKYVRMSDQGDVTPEITSGTKLSVLRKVASSPLLDHTAEVLGAKSNWPKAKIICTIGPASRDPENLARLYECGMRW